MNSEPFDEPSDAPAASAGTLLPSEPSRAGAPPLSRGLVLLMACAAGLVVANLYYAQPLLDLLASVFHVGAATIGLVVTMTQVGYALGLAFLVPLVDIVERRGLVVWFTLASAVTLAGAGAAPSVGVLLAASLAVGFTSVVPQMLVPFAATLAAPEERGRVVGAVMSGLLAGILLGRTVSGFLAAAAGWRTPFFVGAVLVAALAVVLRVGLPRSRPELRASYGAALRSLPAIARRYATLRSASLTGALAFATFSLFWTTLAFHVAGPPFHYGSAAVGMFGLLGLGGTLVASIAGRLSDRRGARPVLLGGVILALAGFVAFALGGETLWGMILGVLLLDMGVQGTHVANQTRIFALSDTERGRIGAVYMVTYFAGAALGSIVGVLAWQRWRWEGVTSAGLALLVLALLSALPNVDAREPGHVATAEPRER